MMNKILIVEDEFSISNFMKTVLEGDGYTVEVATCAAQARAALEKMEFSAMLLDLGLPDADGLELLRELGLKLPGEENENDDRQTDQARKEAEADTV